MESGAFQLSINQLLYSEELSIYSSTDWPIVRNPFYNAPAFCGATGFPSPADDFVEVRLDLHQYHNLKPHTTYFVEARGDSMQDAGITEHDLLIIDTRVIPQDGDIVICRLNSELLIKLVQRIGVRLYLVSRNPAFQPIEIKEYDELRILGVATGLSRRLRRQ